MNPHAAQPVTLTALARSMWQHRWLILQMAKRDVVGRYRGSVMGLMWSLLTPVFMLVVYTFVFSVVFRARWGVAEDETRAQFAVVLFAGLLVHGFFAEVLNRAPGLVLGNVNYVKKVVFPLEVLPAVILGGALFHAAVGILVLLGAYVVFSGVPPWTVILAPLVFMPLALLALGVAWILASIGVFLRDVGQTIGVVTTALLFLSPVFFPLSALPEAYQPLIMANPLTFIIEQAREVLIWGRLPNWTGLLLYSLVAGAIAWLGFVWFQKTRKGFADVL